MFVLVRGFEFSRQPVLHQRRHGVPVNRDGAHGRFESARATGSQAGKCHAVGWAKEDHPLNLVTSRGQ